eukprot:7797543-Ditylum_brightwellii.AAC.1
MAPVSDGISNGENNQSGGTPAICEIMASQSQPKETGHQFQVNAIQHFQISNLEVERNKELCLIDSVSNNGLAGAGMCLYEMAEHL